ncbi:cytochrome P450 4c3-like [Daphnia carinata]|uniref:cytochrome P450 4c3-like n=1 Tax=Daphnia carinata TaxID=120202 RepID=UPI00257A1941|nr:cytochrome P450 4c3-like [Daphnia carinata]
MFGTDVWRIKWSSWFILVIVPIIWYCIWLRSRFVRLVNALPGPKQFPLLGNLLELSVDYDEFLRILTSDWVKKYGSIYRAWLTVHPVIFIASPELLEPILGSHLLISKPKEYQLLKAFIGNSLALITGDRWKNRRRMLTPAFHIQHVNNFVNIFNEKSVDTARQMERVLNVLDDELDVFPIMTQCALDILCESSIGRKTRSQEEKDIYFQNLHKVQLVFMKRIVKPWLGIDWLFQLTNLGRLNKAYVSATRSFTDLVIRDRREWRMEQMKKYPKQGTTKETPDDSVNHEEDLYQSRERPAFLDILLKASEDGEMISEDDIKDEVNLFMVAGHETTAITLSMCLYLIAKHPEQQKLVMEELTQVFGESTRPCSIHDLGQLRYLECCLKETLRLYTPVPFIMRYLTEDVQTGDYTLPKGATVALMLYSMHRNPLFYPDPECFKPERFFPENRIARHQYAFIPFSAGPRNCIGQKFAMLKLKVCLANWIRRFHFSVKDPSAPLFVPSVEVTLKPKHGVHLVIKKRSASR